MGRFGLVHFYRYTVKARLVGITPCTKCTHQRLSEILRNEWIAVISSGRVCGREFEARQMCYDSVPYKSKGFLFFIFYLTLSFQTNCISNTFSLRLHSSTTPHPTHPSLPISPQESRRDPASDNDIKFLGKDYFSLCR